MRNSELYVRKPKIYAISRRGGYYPPEKRQRTNFKFCAVGARLSWSPENQTSVQTHGRADAICPYNINQISRRGGYYPPEKIIQTQNFVYE